MAVEAQGPPRIGLIDFYGRRTVPAERLLSALGAKEGDPLPKSKGDVEDALENVPNVVRAWIEAACCDEGKAILYLGIEEKGAPHFDYRSPPAGLVKLSEDIHEEYMAFLAAVGLAVRAGETAEDLSMGHSLMSNEGVRIHQLRFIDLAKDQLPKIRETLRTSVDEEHRAMAAYVIGYAPKKQDVVDDLQYALRDPDDAVRNNAMRSLNAIAVLAVKKPELGIKIPATWFVEMLDSLVWSDRTSAASALVTMTENRDKAALDLLRERALPTLTEMAQWKHLPHALPAFILVGRIAGIPETDIQALWAKGDRQALIAKLPKPETKKRK